MQCVVCDKNGSLKHQIVLCEGCFTSNDNLICKIDAKKIYALRNSDLLNLLFAYKPAGVGKYTVVYLLTDVEKKAVEVYGSPQKVLQELKKRKEKKQYKLKRRRADMEDRKASVIKHLRSVELETSIDNPFFQKYIQQGEKSGIDIKMITDTIQEKIFYMKCTNYKLILNKLKDSHKDYFRYDRDELELEAKEDALKEFVLNNVGDHRKLTDTIPKSLQEKAFHYSVEFYKEI